MSKQSSRHFAPLNKELTMEEFALFGETMLILNDPKENALLTDQVPKWEPLLRHWESYLIDHKLSEFSSHLRVSSLTAAGFSYFHRFQRLHDSADLDRGIQLWREALTLLPEHKSDYLNQLNVLAIGLGQHYALTHHEPSLDEAISCLEQALNLGGTGTVFHQQTLNNLGNMLHLRFQHTNDISNVNRAIQLYGQLVEHADEKDLMFDQNLHNLCTSLMMRFQHRGNPADLDRAIRAWDEMIKYAPLWSPFRPVYFFEYAEGLAKRWELKHDDADLNHSIDILQTMIDQTPEDDSLYHSALRRLISTLDMRYCKDSSLAELERILKLQERLFQLPISKPGDFPTRLLHIGLYYQNLLRRYGHTDGLGDLETAIQKLKHEYLTMSNDDLALPIITELLETALRQHFLHTGNDDRIEALILQQEDALSFARPNTKLHTQSQQKLGDGLMLRYQQTQVPDDLNRAITLLEQALDAAQLDTKEHSDITYSLGTALHLRYEVSHDLVDLERSYHLLE